MLNSEFNTEYVYRVVTQDGKPVWVGRGSDPFTDRTSARRRKGQLDKASVRDHANAKQRGWSERTIVKHKVQRAQVTWEDDDE